MDNLVTQCPRCRFSLEIPPDFDNVICIGCATAYWVRRHGGALSLSEMWSDAKYPAPAETEAGPLINRRLAEIDEMMEEAELEVEALRSREQSPPLQMGCAFFGLFMAIIVVSALFMLLGKSYFGSWIFYASIVAVAVLGFVRIRRKSVSRAQREIVHRDRLLAENGLSQLAGERDRLQRLRSLLNSDLNPSEPTD